MASITSVTGVPKYISWGEQFDPEEIKITLKLGSTETITSKSTSNFRSVLLIGDYTKTSAGYETSAFGFVDDTYNAFIPSFFIQNGSEFTIGKGGQKSFLWGSSEYLPCTPNSTINIAGHTGVLAKDYLTEKYITDGGSARRYPMTLYANVYDSSHDYGAVVRNQYYFLNERIDPEIVSFVISDSGPKDSYTYFGAFVQNKSKPKFTIGFKLDPLDPTLTATHTLTIRYGSNTKTYTKQTDSTVGTGGNVGTVVFDLEPFTNSGQITYSYSVVDNHNYNIGQSGIIDVIPYSAPTINARTGLPLIQRYIETQDQYGQTEYLADELGHYLWINAITNVSYIYRNGHTNSWNLKLEWDNHTATIASGTNGSQETFTNERDTLLSNVFPAGNQYSFTLKLTDYFDTTTSNVIVEKGTGYFDIEKTGVAVGMLSKSTQTDRRFESAYPAFFYEGISTGIIPTETDTTKTTTERWVSKPILIGLNGTKKIYRKRIQFTPSTATTTGAKANLDIITFSDFIDIGTSVSQIYGISGIYKTNSAVNQWKQVNHYYSTTDYSSLYFDSSSTQHLRFNYYQTNTIGVINIMIDYEVELL